MHKAMTAARDLLPPVLFGVLVLVVWETVTRLGQIPPTMVPGPSRIVTSLIEQAPLFGQHAWPTFYQTLLGFVLSVMIGVATGWLIGKSKLIYRAFYPIVVLLQVLPKEALAPLLVIWFGAGVFSRLTLAFLTAFFPMVINTILAIRSIPPNVHQFAHSLSCNWWQMFFKVELPWSLPYIFAGMKISITLSVIGVVVAEIVAGRNGLGYLLLFASSRMNIGFSLAILFVLAILGAVLFGLIVLAEKRFIYWKT